METLHVHWIALSGKSHVLILSKGKLLILFGDGLGRINMWCTCARVCERKVSWVERLIT